MIDQQQQQLPEPLDHWRAHLAEMRLEEGQISRLARVLLKFPFCGVHPCKALIRELLANGYDWAPAAFAQHYTAFTGIPVNIESLLPTQEELKFSKKSKPANAPQFQYRKPHEKYLGIVKRKDGQWEARLRVIGGKVIVLGVGSDIEMASLYDSAAKKRGTSCTLNFRPDRSSQPFNSPLGRAA